MIYAICFALALGGTFVWALCKAAARADAAMVGWARLVKPPDEELDDLVEGAIEDCDQVLGARPRSYPRAIRSQRR